MIEETLLITALNLAGWGAIWYKLGLVEQKVNDHVRGKK